MLVAGSGYAGYIREATPFPRSGVARRDSVRRTRAQVERQLRVVGAGIDVRRSQFGYELRSPLPVS